MLVLIIAAFKYNLVGVYGPRQNLLRCVVITFFLTTVFDTVTLKCAKTSRTAGIIIILMSACQVSDVLRHLCTNAASYTCTTAF